RPRAGLGCDAGHRRVYTPVIPNESNSKRHLPRFGSTRRRTVRRWGNRPKGIPVVKSRKLLSSAAAAVAATLVLTGCGTKSSEGDDTAAAGCVDTSGDSVKLGFLNSLSGTMAISEVTVSNSLKL